LKKNLENTSRLTTIIVNKMDNAERIPKNFDVLYIVFFNFDNNIRV